MAFSSIKGDVRMDQHKSLFSISHDHFHGQLLVQLIDEELPQYPEAAGKLRNRIKNVIEFYDRELANHFYIEEEVLQPAVRGITEEIDGIFDEIIQEHLEIEKTVKSLKKKTDDPVKTLKRFAVQLGAHIQKEERVLFIKIRDALDSEELKQLAANLNEKGYEHIYN